MKLDRLNYEQLVQHYKQELLADDKEMEQLEARLEKRLASSIHDEEMKSVRS